jgi:hypothetical protein
MDSLMPKATVKREGKWIENEGSHLVLVPGDIISIKIGDIAPADCREPYFRTYCADALSGISFSWLDNELKVHMSGCRQKEVDLVDGVRSS